MVNSILSAVLSFVIPGLGQAYAGEFKKGALFFFIAILIHYGCSYLAADIAHAVTPIFITFIGFVPWLFHAYAAFDAFTMWNSLV